MEAVPYEDDKGTKKEISEIDVDAFFWNRATRRQEEKILWRHSWRQWHVKTTREPIRQSMICMWGHCCCKRTLIKQTVTSM